MLPTADIQIDVTKGLPFADDSVSGVYSEHFIEHLTQSEILRLLRECRRVLLPGARVRVATPDLDLLVEEFHGHGWRQPWLEKYGYEWVANRAEYINICMREWGHKYLVNQEELFRLGSLSGLKIVGRYEVGVSDDPMLSNLETRHESTLIVEFEKIRHSNAVQPLVSVVIPAYRSDFFEECLNSAINQSYSKIEILVGDDSGGAGIEDVCRRAIEAGAQVRYFKNLIPLGEAENFTLLIKQAHGEFIKPLHDDDLLEAHAVSQLVSRFQTSPGATLAVGPRCPVDELGCRLDASMFGTPLGSADALFRGSHVLGRMLSASVNVIGEPTCMLFRRVDALDIAEPTVMSLFGRKCYGAGDVCLSVHLLCKGELAYTSNKVASVRRHAGQAQAQVGHLERGLETWRYLRQQGIRLGLLNEKGDPYPEDVFTQIHQRGVDFQLARPEVSVGLITYNQQPYVKDAIESILKQTWPVDRLVICDDCSTDDTWNVVVDTIDQFRQTDSLLPEIVFERNAVNIGYLANFQKVLKLASGDIFIYQAGDDISLPHRVERILEAYAKAGNPKYCLLHSNVYIDRIHAENVWRSPAPSLHSDRDIVLSDALHIGATEAFTPALLLDFGDIVEHTYDDLILGVRACVAGTYTFIDEPLLIYRSGGLTGGNLHSKDVDRSSRFLVSTLMQRYRDVSLMGRRDLADVLEVEITNLGADVPVVDMVPMALALAGHGAANQCALPVKAKNILLVTVEPDGGRLSATRIDRFRLLQQAGLIGALRIFSPDKRSDSFNEFQMLSRDVDLIWVFQVPFDLESSDIVDSLLYGKKFVVWECCHRFVDVSLTVKPSASDCVREKIAGVLLRRAALVVTASSRLADLYRKKTQSPVVVVPDYIPSAWLAVATYSESRCLTEVKHVTAFTHGASEQELVLLADTILQMLHGWPGQIRFTIFGPAPVVLIPQASVRVELMPMRDHQLLSRLTQDPVHLALMPMLAGLDHEFKGRSTWLLWAVAGVPVLTSDIGVFDDLVAAGLLRRCQNIAQTWSETALEMLQSPAMLFDIGRDAASFARTQCVMESAVSEWLSLLNQNLPTSLQFPTSTSNVVGPLRMPTDEELTIPVSSYQRWLSARSQQEIDGESLAQRMVRWRGSPSLLVVSVLSADQMDLLPVTLMSLQRQLCSDWRWVILSDESYPEGQYVFSERVGWLQLPTLADAHVLTQTIQDVCGELDPTAWGFVEVGSCLQPDAVIEVLDGFLSQPDVHAIYSDHDHWDNQFPFSDVLSDVTLLDQRRCHPVFKPGFDIHWFRQLDFIGPALWFRTRSMQALGGLMPLPNAWSFELCLRMWEHCSEGVRHLSSLLVSVPKTVDSSESARTSVLGRQVAVEFHLKRVHREWSRAVVPGLVAGSLQVELVSPEHCQLSVVWVVRNDYFQVRESLKGLLAQEVLSGAEVVVVANQVTDPDLKQLLQDLPRQTPGLVVVPDEGPFNAARLYNLGARHASGRWLLFGTADVQWVDTHSAQRLVAAAAWPGVSVAGPALLTPETGMVDSAGMVPAESAEWPVAKPFGQGLGFYDGGPWNSLRVFRRVAGLESVVVAMSRTVWQGLQGFDESLGQVDFVCDAGLRAGELGLGDTVWTPYARVVHVRGAMAYRLHVTGEVQPQHASEAKAQAQAFWLKHRNRWASHPAHSLHLSLRSRFTEIDDTVPIRWPLKDPGMPRTLAYAPMGASGEYRVKLPMRSLMKAGKQFTEVLDRARSLLLTPAELLRLQPDHVLIHQSFSSDTERAIRAYKRISPKLRFIVGMDDRSDAVPEKNATFELSRRLMPNSRAHIRKILDLADAVVVSTHPLADMVRDLGLNGAPIRVIPNALQREDWAHLRPPRLSRKKPRVGWVGALQHRGDLELLLPIIQKTHDVVDWVFMGMTLPDASHRIKEAHKPVPFRQYPGAMARLDLDLAVAPLEMNLFNEAKSNLRLLEYGALGYPVICTDITPYRDNAPPVIRLPNDPDMWIQAILESVRNLDQLQRKGQQLKKWVFSRFLAEHHVSAWHKAITGQK